MRNKREMNGLAAAGTPNSSGSAASLSSSSASANINQGGKDRLSGELWHACAGGSVHIPRCGEKVLYFPQGHLEQVTYVSSTLPFFYCLRSFSSLSFVAAFIQHQQDGHMDIPVHNLPSKILCRVVSVQLKAEAYTDEVFAQVTLLPELKQDGLNLEDTGTDKIPSRASVYSFCKILTPSDTSTHGGFSVPKRHAVGCFPPLDLSLEAPTQELVAKDLHGFEWQFRQIYRGQPKRHLLTSGWSTFLNAKKLVAGDTCVFIRGENGELRVGIRRAVKQHNNASTSTSLISGDSMQLGILASASHAVATGSMFTVYYHPWTNSFEFIIPLQHYLKATEMNFSAGMRVQMLLEVEESERRYAGTIIGVEDIDGSRWPGSEWRCLKVQWDAIQDSYMHAERVCPWWIEPLDSAKPKHTPILPPPKKARVPNLPLPGLGGFAKEDIVQNSAKPASQRVERDLHGQDYNAVASPQAVIKRPSIADALPPSKVIYDSKLGVENQLRFLLQDPLHQSTGSSMLIPLEDLSTSSSNVNCTGSESQGWSSSESKDENDVPFGHPGSHRTYKLFGVSLSDNQPELPSPQFAKISSTLCIPPMSQSSIYATIGATKPYGNIPGVTAGKTCKKCHAVNSRSCTKVLKQGTALGRAIDLTRFAGFYELISELDWMFDFGGSLINGSSGWHVTCIDDDGNIMLLGDSPWQDFQSTVQKMIICPKDGINHPSPSSSACPTSI